MTGVDDTTRRLMRIAPRSRQAFLLTALEGFTPSEAAQILDADFSEVEQLIAEAQAEIDAELATDVLIIEDEPVIAADIEALVKELGHTVVDIAATRSEAVDAVARKQPGLVLADLLVINKVDLAPQVGADLEVMRRDSELVREGRPFVFSNCRTGDGVESVISFLENAASDHALKAGLWSEHAHPH